MTFAVQLYTEENEARAWIDGKAVIDIRPEYGGKLTRAKVTGVFREMGCRQTSKWNKADWGWATKFGPLHS